MQNALAVAGALISSSGAIPYILDIVRGKTHPNLVSWVTYSLVNVVSGFAALSAGEPHTAILSFFGLAATGSIAVMGIRHGVRKYTAFDITCQVLAITGIVLWQFTGNPTIAICIAIIVELIASLPTWRHAWIAPYAETWQGFLLGGAGCIFTILSLSRFNFISLAFQIAVIIVNATVIRIILSRRRVQSQPAT